jgi:hypothetical protein
MDGFVRKYITLEKALQNFRAPKNRKTHLLPSIFKNGKCGDAAGDYISRLFCCPLAVEEHPQLPECILHLVLP